MWTGGELLTAVAQAKPYDCVTEAQMVKLARLAPEVVADCCAKLIKAGLLRKTGRGCHQITAAGRAAAAQEEAEARRQSRSELYERVWYVLRNKPTHTAAIPEIVELVAEGGEKCIVERISGYLCALARAGYAMQMPIRERGHTRSGNGHVRWRLLQDTGPRAPVWRRPRGKWKARHGSLYDPNTRKELPLAKDFARASRRSTRKEAAAA